MLNEKLNEMPYVKIVYFDDINNIWEEEENIINKNMPIFDHILKNKLELGQEGTINDCKFRIIETVFSDREMFLGKIKSYGYTGFFQYTDYNNLKSIYEHKFLYSRSNLQERNIKFYDYANKNIIGGTIDSTKNSVRMHFRPKTPDFCATVNKYKPCYLIIDFDIFNKLEQEIYVTRKVAVKAEMYNVNNSEEMKKIYDNFNYDMVFNNQYSENENEKKIKMAEILVSSKLEINYIKEIAFFNIDDMKKFENDFPEWKIKKRIEKDWF